MDKSSGRISKSLTSLASKNTDEEINQILIDSVDANTEENDLAQAIESDSVTTVMDTRRRGKYHRALQTLKPVRLKPSPKEECPVHYAGLFSFMSVHWLTSFVWQVYKSGICEYENLWKCPKSESAHVNGKRFERLWREEVKRKGIKDASLGWTLIRFIRTRLIVGLLVNICTMTFAFIGPTIFFRALLNYLNDPEDHIWYGLSLAFMLFIVEIFRVLCFVTVWLVSYEIALRAKSGIMTMVFDKILRLRSLKDKSVGEIVNLFANDSQRIFDAVSLAPLLLGSPLMAIAATIYCVFILGPWALLGSTIIVLFYPYQMFISKLTTQLRRKTIKITDKRVRMMNEILTCIKLIKLYAWEKSFAKCVAGIRQQEKHMLQKMAYVQTLSIGFTPMVPVFAAVAAFASHTLAGNDLTVTQAFVVYAVLYKAKRSCSLLQLGSRAIPLAIVAMERAKAFVVIAVYLKVRLALAQLNFIKAVADVISVVERLKAYVTLAVYFVTRKCLQHLQLGINSVSELIPGLERVKAFVVLACYMLSMKKMGVVPYAVKSRAETAVTLGRIKSILVMEEFEPEKLNRTPSDASIAIEIKNGTFAWDTAKPITDDKPGEKKDAHSDKNHTKEKTVHKTSLSRKTPIYNPKGNLHDNPKLLKNTNGSAGITTNGVSESIKDELEVLNTTDDSDDRTDVLFGINLDIKKGELCGVCGTVGSGKSSLISAVLGQMLTTQGNVAVSGQVAYVPQQAWILNETLKENILFGKPYDEDRYNTVLEQCSLKADLQTLPAGDQTEIGERGINLSGGQKQRVSLARAVYNNRDVYLLDDPLSAVDPHVGQHLFEQCLKGSLKEKTVIFVTHQLQYLSQCDQVILLKDGMVLEKGPHSKLMKLEGEYSALINTFHAQKTEEPEEDVEVTIDRVASAHLSAVSLVSNAASITSVTTQGEADDKEAPKPGSKLIEAEEVSKGAVSWSSYVRYFQAAGGVMFSVFVLATFGIPVACSAMANFWLSYWLNQGSGNTTFINNTMMDSGRISDNPDLYFYTGVYAAIAAAVIITTLIRGFLFMAATLKASSRLHDSVFVKILRSPMSFFDTTPIGRTLNRFSRDLDEVDVRLPFRAEQFLQNVCLVLTCLLIISFVFPWFLIAVVPLAIIFGLLNVIYRVVLRQVKRADNVSRSPLFSHIATSVQGLQTIHAYNKREEFLDKFKKHFDQNSMPLLLFYFCMRWLAFRLDMLASLIIMITSFLIVITKGDIPPAYSALALVYAAQITGLFQFTIRLASETEAHFTSVERIQFYIDNIDTEAPAVVKSNRPADGWPHSGAISCKNYTMRYRPGLPLVLRGIDFDIKGEENIGIVGRTGSGKSSLTLALFRIVESAGGTIKIDGVDISKIGLEDLRSRLAIIPQDPVLFVGTIRYNLDPFGHHDDTALWNALEKCHVKENIVSLEGQLDAPVVENGENFSVGERQLICMARALLRHSKIIVLDEATAAIDTETDAKIQITIKEAFSNCTMLTIAHRLNTVLSCDRILVLDDGRIVEFDQPSKLLEDTHSMFHGMMQATDLSAKTVSAD